MPSPAVYQGICACYAGGVGALQLHGGYSSLSCVPVSGRPVGSGCDAVLDSAPAYPLSDHMGAPWSVWSVLWRLLLLCPRRSHIPVCGHLVWFWLYIYWSVFAVPFGNSCLVSSAARDKPVVSLGSKCGSTVPSFIPWSMVHSSTV